MSKGNMQFLIFVFMNLIKPQFHMKLKRTYNQYYNQQVNINYSYFIQTTEPKNILNFYFKHFLIW